jgi:peroxiredoxin Q/BCP
LAEKRSKKDQQSATVSIPSDQEKKSPSSSSSNKPPKVGDTIALDKLGGEIETNDGIQTTLKKLVGESKSGIVLFTYPRASTPGCKSNDC